MIVTGTKIGDFGNKSYLWSVLSDNYGEKDTYQTPDRIGS